MSLWDAVLRAIGCAAAGALVGWAARLVFHWPPPL
jgi:hypothetical protein